MLRLFFILIFLFFIKTYSQNQIDTLQRDSFALMDYNKLMHYFYKESKFYDLNLKNIDSITYKNKCKNIALKCKAISINDTIHHVIFNTFKFGKLKKHQLNRLKYYIYKDTSYNGKIIIHFKEKLLSFDSYKNNFNERVYFNNLNYDSVKGSTTPPFQSLSKKLSFKHQLPKGKWVSMGDNKYRLYRKQIMKTDEEIIENKKKEAIKIKKCRKKYKKKHNSDLLHYYSKGDNSLNPNIEWIKDSRNLIRNYFFKYTDNYYYVIIKQDGEYIQIGSLITPKKIKKLLNNDDWSRYKRDLRLTKQKNKRIGFFYMQHIHNCL